MTEPINTDAHSKMFDLICTDSLYKTQTFS